MTGPHGFEKTEDSDLHDFVVFGDMPSDAIRCAVIASEAHEPVSIQIHRQGINVSLLIPATRQSDVALRKLARMLLAAADVMGAKVEDTVCSACELPPSLCTCTEVRR